MYSTWLEKAERARQGAAVRSALRPRRAAGGNLFRARARRRLPVRAQAGQDLGRLPARQEGLLPQDPGRQDAGRRRDHQAAVRACSSEGHNNTATQFITIDHVRSPKVWIAYSRYVWDRETRKDYEDDKDGCRTARMTELNVKDIADGKVGPGSTAPNTCKLTMPDITEIVADYAPADVQRCLNAGLHNPLQLRAEPEPQLLTASMWGEFEAAGVAVGVGWCCPIRWGSCRN
ncbi:toxin VasX [Achromobacter xylosoxidans]